MTGKLLLTLIVLLSVFSLDTNAQNTETAKYMHVSDVSLLRDGDEVIIVSSGCGVAMSRYQNAKKEYILPCAVSVFEEDGLDMVSCETDSMAVFTLKKVSDGWRLKDAKSGWLCAKKNTDANLVFVNNDSSERSLIDFKFSNEGDAHISFISLTREHQYIDYKFDTKRFKRFNRYDFYGKVQVYRRYVAPVVVENLTLSEAEGNADLVSYYQDAYVHSITIDRTFRADGGYYTLCLPFALTEDDMRTAFPGMQFKQLKDIEEVDEDKVVYHFLSVKSTVAGEPYLVRILPGVTNDIVKPVVKNKFILATKPSVMSSLLSSGNFKFIGIYDPTLIPADGRYRFVSADGTELVPPNTEGNLKGLRAYFLLPEPYATCEFDSNGKPRAVVIAVDGAELSK